MCRCSLQYEFSTTFVVTSAKHMLSYRPINSSKQTYVGYWDWQILSNSANKSYHPYNIISHTLSSHTYVWFSELPSPKLASMSEVRTACMKVLRVTRPTELGYNYEELKAMDEVTVNLLPEKKGMVFKHVEYLVESKVQ